MPRVGFKNVISMFEKYSSLHALDWAATVAGTIIR